MPTNSVFNPNDDQAVEARIKWFNQAIQQKQGQPMTVNDAIWNIEAALNYNYCHVELPQGNTYQDSIFIEYLLNDGKLDFCNVENAYQQAKAKLLNLIKKESFHAIVVDVKPLQISDVFKAKITFLVGDGVLNKYVTYPNSFGSNDNWRWGMTQGKCNGTEFGIDARHQIMYWLNSGLSYIPGQYFTDIVSVDAILQGNNFINTNDNVPEDNYLDYLIFINRKFGVNGDLLTNFYPTLTPGYCISYEEMNFYAWSYRNIAINTPANGGIRPANKNIINYTVDGYFIFYCEQNNCTYLKQVAHKLTVKYGILHIGNQN